MNNELTKYRNDLKKLFKRYGIHRAIRSDHLNILIDDIHTYHNQQNETVSVEFHEQQLKDQLSGWVKYLTNEKNKLVEDDSDYNTGVKDGFEKFLQTLKDVAER